MNRLENSGSDYLRQHAHQAIDWWPWCDEAFQVAKEKNLPVFLSIGYASCHWCHVMSRESFDDPHIAAYLNEHFVAIKVDRQTHPEVDAVYMAATQALTGAGGWPTTCFLTPDREPFFAGTYYPPNPRPAQPSFRQVLETIHEAWTTRAEEVTQSAKHIVAQLGQKVDLASDDLPSDQELFEALRKDFDLIHGGFGKAPKFPHPTLLDALLVKGDHTSLDMAQLSLEAMARGAICDQVGGGFHRYTVDAGWVVPHFEKMLSDNALLLGAYLRGWRRLADHDSAKRALLERVAYGIVEWVEREMLLPEGGFAAALDADSCDIKGSIHEGIYYLWSPALLTDALGEADGEWASEVFHVTEAGTFEDGLSTLQLRGVIDFERLAQVTDALLRERANRFPPARDELVVTSWNAWLISSLVYGAMIFDESHWFELALKAGKYLVNTHQVGGKWMRSSLAGEPNDTLGGCGDYGALASAFADLAAVSGDDEWLALAVSICENALELFSAEDGGFYDFVASDLYERPRQLTDPATPAPSMVLIGALRKVALLSGRMDLADRADAAARTSWTAIGQFTRHCGAGLQDFFIQDEVRHGLSPALVVVVSDDPFNELTRAAWRLAPAGSVVVTGTSGFGDLFTGREAGAAYICRDQTCLEPIRDYAELKDPLWQRG